MTLPPIFDEDRVARDDDETTLHSRTERPPPSPLERITQSISRMLSPERKNQGDVQPARSPSRGREGLNVQSTGRGGAGNFRRSDSVSRDRVKREEDGDERGRELSPSRSGLTHSGRGGAGNIRSPSRDPAAEKVTLAIEKEVIDAAREREKTVIHSSGRGGLGNMAGSPARDDRSRSREPRFSSGRGGAGNIRDGSRDTRSLDNLEEDERKAHAHQNGIHSTGRGGLANVTDLPDPQENHSTRVAPDAHPDGPHSSGRGGAGNIIHAIASKIPGFRHGHGHEDQRGRNTDRKEVQSDLANDINATVGLGGPGLVGGPISGIAMKE